MFPTIQWVFPTAGLRYSAQRDFEFSTSSFAEALKGEEIISQWFDVWDIKTPDDKQRAHDLPGYKRVLGILPILSVYRAGSTIGLPPGTGILSASDHLS
jgi:hypothetical protein